VRGVRVKRRGGNLEFNKQLVETWDQWALYELQHTNDNKLAEGNTGNIQYMYFPQACCHTVELIQ